MRPASEGRVQWRLTLCALQDQHVVRAMSLLPGDASPAEEIAFVRLAHR